jgi:hypothetical protein
MITKGFRAEYSRFRYLQDEGGGVGWGGEAHGDREIKDCCKDCLLKAWCWGCLFKLAKKHLHGWQPLMNKLSCQLCPRSACDSLYTREGCVQTHDLISE